MKRAVELLHEAELDDDAWPKASRLIDEACGLQGSDLLLASHLGAEGNDIHLRWLFLRGEPNPELYHDYAENYSEFDERGPTLIQQPFGKLTHTTSLMPGKVRKRSAVYNEYLVPNAGENCLNVRMPVRGRMQMAWSLVGPGGGSPSDWTGEQVEAVRQLLPHVHQFIRVRHALAEARADGYRGAALLDTPRIGVLLLDRRGRIVEANDRARTLLEHNHSLGVRSGCLAATPPADANGVASVLKGACAEGLGGSITIPRQQRTPLTLHATPMAAYERRLLAGRYAARVLLAEPFSTPPINVKRTAAALGLTLTQGQVAAALAAGSTVAEIAVATHRTEATVRWHIREALSRLGLSRQVDLVRGVLSSPGVFEESN